MSAHVPRAIAIAVLISLGQARAFAQPPAPAAAPESAPAATSTPMPTAPSAATQTPPPESESAMPTAVKPRGNGSLFGGSDTAAAVRPIAIDATLSVSSAYDDDLSEGQNASALTTPVGGEYSEITGTLTLSRKRQHSHADARATSSVRHYPSLDRLIGSSYSAGGDVGVQLSSRTSLQASVDGAYVSEFAFDTIARQSGLGNVALSATGLEAAALDRARVSYGAVAGLTRKAGTRAALTVTVAARSSERPILNETSTERSIAAYFSRAVGRNTSIGLGYSIRGYSDRFGGIIRPAWSHDVQAGINHRWRHSRQRNTAFSLSFGPSLLETTAEAVPGATPAAIAALPTGRMFNLVGSAALSHDMSRSWNLGTSYRRSAVSVDGFTSDSISLDLRGLLNRRVEMTLSGGYFRSDLGAAGTLNHYETTTGSGRLQVALGRAIALYAQYVLYDFSYGSGTVLAAAVPPQQRRGARAGITLWKPLYGGR